MTADDASAVHVQQRRAVDRALCVHRVDKGHVINALTDIGEQVRDHLPALAIRPEPPLRADDPPTSTLTLSPEGRDVDGLAVVSVQLGLVVKGVDLAWAAVHKEEDHALGLGRVGQEPAAAEQHGGVRACAVRGACLRREKRVAEQSRERHSGKAPGRLPEKLTAGPPAEMFVVISHCSVQPHELVGVEKHKAEEPQRCELIETVLGSHPLDECPISPHLFLIARSSER